MIQTLVSVLPGEYEDLMTLEVLSERHVHQSDEFDVTSGNYKFVYMLKSKCTRMTLCFVENNRRYSETRLFWDPIDFHLKKKFRFFG